MTLNAVSYDMLHMKQYHPHNKQTNKQMSNTGRDLRCETSSKVKYLKEREIQKYHQGMVQSESLPTKSKNQKKSNIDSLLCSRFVCF